MKRVINPEIKPGYSITRFHLETEGSWGRVDSSEVHASHYPEGDLSKPAQWYDIFQDASEAQLGILRTTLNIDKEDWGILEHLLGSFKWALFFHALPDRKNQIRLDEDAMRSGEWSTVYF